MQEHDDMELEANSPEEPVVDVAAEEAVQEVDLPEEIQEVLDAHAGDPDWSEEEIKKALDDPHAKYNPKGPRSPGEFNRNGSYLNKIKDMKSHHTREMNMLKRQLDDLKSHMTNNEQRNIQKEAQEIQAKRMAAVEYGDKETFVALDQQFAELQQRMQHAAPPVPLGQSVDLPEEIQEFYGRNQDWINGGTAEADIILYKAREFESQLKTQRLTMRQAELNDIEMAKRIEAYVHREFPDKFRNSSNRSRPAAVEQVDSPRIKPVENRAGLKDLNSFQREACQRFITDNPGSTVEEYIGLMNLPGSGVDLTTLAPKRR